MSSNGFYNGNKSFLYNHWLCAWCVAHRYRVLLPNWKIMWRTTLARSNRIIFSSYALDFPLLFSVLILSHIFHFSHHTADLFPPPLSRWFVCSLSQCSCPLLIFLFDIFFLTSNLSFPFLLHPLCPLLFASVMSVFFFLPHYFLHSYCFLPPPPNVPTCVTPSRSFPSVLWKLSPLWGCLAEDRSPSAPAVPLKVT